MKNLHIFLVFLLSLYEYSALVEQPDESFVVDMIGNKDDDNERDPWAHRMHKSELEGTPTPPIYFS